MKRKKEFYVVIDNAGNAQTIYSKKKIAQYKQQEEEAEKYWDNIEQYYDTGMINGKEVNQFDFIK